MMFKLCSTKKKLDKSIFYDQTIWFYITESILKCKKLIKLLTHKAIYDNFTKFKIYIFGL